MNPEQNNMFTRPITSSMAKTLCALFDHEPMADGKPGEFYYGCAKQYLSLAE